MQITFEKVNIDDVVLNLLNINIQKWAGIRSEHANNWHG